MCPSSEHTQAAATDPGCLASVSTLDRPRTASSLLPRRRDTEADPLASTGKVALDISTTIFFDNINEFEYLAELCRYIYTKTKG